MISFFFMKFLVKFIFYNLLIYSQSVLMNFCVYFMNLKSIYEFLLLFPMKFYLDRKLKESFYFNFFLEFPQFYSKLFLVFIFMLELEYHFFSPIKLLFLFIFILLFKFIFMNCQFFLVFIHFCIILQFFNSQLFIYLSYLKFFIMF